VTTTFERSRVSSADGGTQRAPVPLFIAAACAATILLTAAVAASGKASVYSVVFAAAVLGLVLACVMPRLALLGTLVMLVTYADETIGHGKLSLAGEGVALMLAAAILIRHRLGIEQVRFPRDVRWFGPMLATVGFVTLFARDRPLAMKNLTDDLGAVVLVAVIVVLVDSTKWLRRAMWAVVLPFAGLALITILQQVTHRFGDTFGGFATVLLDRGTERSGGPLSANFFGEVLASGAVLAGYLAFAARRRFERIVAVVCAAAMLTATVYTLSRGVWLAVAVAAVVIAVARGIRWSRLAIGAIAVVLVGSVLLPSTLKDRIGAVAGLTQDRTASDSSLRGRVSENLAAYEMFLDHPLVGVGPRNFEVEYPAYAQRIGLDQRTELRAAHSLYLQSLAETGVVGSIPFFALLALALVQPWRARRRVAGHGALLAEGACVAMLTFLLCGLTLHLAYPRYLWIFLALALAAGRLGENGAHNEAETTGQQVVAEVVA
jgi:O-antigen ligase